MGQEASQPLPDNVPSRTLEKRDIASLAKYIKRKNPKIVVMVRLHPSAFAQTNPILLLDRRRHIYLRRNPRLPLPHHRALREPRTPQPPIRRSRLRYRILPRTPRALLHAGARAIPRQVSANYHALLHPPPLRQGPPPQTIHTEHRLSGTSGWRAR